MELFTNFNINHILTESDVDNVNVRPQLEQQIQIQESKESGWIFDKFISWKNFFL